MPGNVSGNDANHAAYANRELVDVYSRYDNKGDAEIINNEEAKQSSSWNSSVFGKGSAYVDEQIRDAISKDSRLSDAGGDVASVVKRYLGASGSLFSNAASSFGTIHYTKSTKVDKERIKIVQQQIDSGIDAEIETMAGQVVENVNTNFRDALNKAIQAAGNQLCGDADVINNCGKDDSPEGFNTRLNKGLRYGTDTKATAAAFYSQAIGGASTVLGQGYTATCTFLRNNGASEYTREVDGQQMTIFKLKGGEHVCVDDAGQVHTLYKTKVSGKNCYTTRESVQALGINTDGLDVNHKIDGVVRRKVDGEYRTVNRDGDNVTVSDYDANTGSYVASSDLIHVNAGLKAKYASGVTGDGSNGGTSSLGSAVRDGDNLSFQNGKVRTGTHVNDDGIYATTQRSRARIAKGGLDAAVKNIEEMARIKHCDFQDYPADGKATVDIGGIIYTIDKNNPTQADAQMRIIRAKLQQLPDPDLVNPINGNRAGVGDGDDRVDANSVNHTDDGDTQDNVATGGTYGVRFDDATDPNHRSAIRGGASTHSLNGHYHNDVLTRSQFHSEGWYTRDSQRRDEGDIITKMDDETLRSKSVANPLGLSVRNLTNAKEFAVRFLEAKNLRPDDYNIELLAKAIAKANPSIFDESVYDEPMGDDGIAPIDRMNMYKNADFDRINLPRKLDRYKKS
ncbi:MAG: hypothetical protein K6E29_04380 [Cyanobacteria bacterium RUI128]|nr:hypothetical protein [Cyanobacteria bacterium RUI128]